MSMSKQNFIALADTMRQLRERIEHSTRSPEFKNGRLEEHTRTVSELAEFCHSQNPAFKRERWLGYIAGENGAGGKVK